MLIAGCHRTEEEVWTRSYISKIWEFTDQTGSAWWKRQGTVTMAMKSYGLYIEAGPEYFFGKLDQ